MIATAPGKVLLAGEYAVLDGHPGVVAAISRRARATIGPSPALLSPFLAAARDELERAGAAASRAAARVVVDTSELSHQGHKLGLGSSAAATVAAVAAALGTEGAATVDVFRSRVHALAHRAHGAAQAPRGARGSGADIAAAVHGGVLLVRRRPDLPETEPLAYERLVWPDALTLVLVWTGQPADTPSLVARVRAAAAADPQAHSRRLASLGDVSLGLVAALQSGSAAAAIESIAAGATALAALGEASGAPLVPELFQSIGLMAAAHGGAAKPTGAGGGDLVAALFPDPAAATAFARRAADAGFLVPRAPLDSRGVSLAGEPGSE